MKILIIIDVQNDFCPGGSLGVPEGKNIIPMINKLSLSGIFDMVIATQDWHPREHISFASRHKKGAFSSLHGETLWPDHCIQGQPGAELHSLLNQESIKFILRKGMNAEMDSYSAFLENDKKTKTGLERLIPEDAAIYLAGIATDVCVFHTAVDGNKIFEDVYVIRDACAAVDESKIEDVYKDLERAGVKVIKQAEIL